MKSKTFKQGGHIPHYKSLTQGKPIEALPVPEEVVISLAQHIGAPCDSLVAVGDVVSLGQKIGDSAAHVSAPVHSSVNGVVTAVEPRPHCSGKLVPSIVIKVSDAGQWDQQGGQDLEFYSTKEILDTIREAGIVGLGGAGFPTRVKLSPPAHKPIDTVILNGAECEPFLTADHRCMLEMAKELIFGTLVVMKVLGASRGFIGIEDNKPDAITHLQQVLQDNPNIEVVPLATKYPQGGEKQLIFSITGREVPRGGLPMDVGVVVQNIGTAVAIAQALSLSKPLIERVVTVSGPAVPQIGRAHV